MGLLKFVQNLAETFASQCAPPISMTLVQICHRCQRHQQQNCRWCRWCKILPLVPLVLLYRWQHLEQRISPRMLTKKNRNGPNGILRGSGETDSWKNLKSKISWHCHFKLRIISGYLIIRCVSNRSPTPPPPHPHFPTVPIIYNEESGVPHISLGTESLATPLHLYTEIISAIFLKQRRPNQKCIKQRKCHPSHPPPPPQGEGWATKKGSNSIIVWLCVCFSCGWQRRMLGWESNCDRRGGAAPRIRVILNLKRRGRAARQRSWLLNITAETTLWTTSVCVSRLWLIFGAFS